MQASCLGSCHDDLHAPPGWSGMLQGLLLYAAGQACSWVAGWSPAGLPSEASSRVLLVWQAPGALMWPASLCLVSLTAGLLPSQARVGFRGVPVALLVPTAAGGSRVQPQTDLCRSSRAALLAQGATSARLAELTYAGPPYSAHVVQGAGAASIWAVDGQGVPACHQGTLLRGFPPGQGSPLPEHQRSVLPQLHHAGCTQATGLSDGNLLVKPAAGNCCVRPSQNAA